MFSSSKNSIFILTKFGSPLFLLGILLISNSTVIFSDINEIVVPSSSQILPNLRSDIDSGKFSNVFEDLGLDISNEVIPDSDYDILGKLRDNENEYVQIWTPWLSRGAIHIAKVSEDGEFLVIGGGYLLDTELHIYRWNTLDGKYVKVWEAGSGILTRDVYDVAFGDSDNNNLIEIAAACADGRVYLFEQAHISDPIANLENRFDFVWKSENFFQATSVEFFDGDLDGIQDLIVGSWDNKIHMFEYTAHSGYPFDVEHWITLTERWTSSILDDKVQSLDVGDFNNNGLPDFVVGTISGSLYVFENDGVVLAPQGIEFPFPNDNNYRQIWNTSGTYQPIWNTIGQIETADINGLGGSEAVILAWGQGVWVLQYSDSRGFYLEQLTQPFEDWSKQGYYPLDNFADWMVDDESLNWQVYYIDENGTRYPEPWDFATSDKFDKFANSAVTGEPDGVLSTTFLTNQTHQNATGTWNLGVGEELASNGNEDPDLYIIFDSTSALIPDEWNISLSNNLFNWYQLESSSISPLTNGTGLAIDIDPLYASKRLTSSQYIKLTLLQGNRSDPIERKVNAIVFPNVARPLTLTTSVTIEPLAFEYFNPNNENKIIFGCTDGRILVFEHEDSDGLYFYKKFESKPAELTLIPKSNFGIVISDFQQEWDSYTDDFYNLGETIWSIQGTPKQTEIPSWRYLEGETKEFNGETDGKWDETFHSMSVSNLDESTPESELIVTHFPETNYSVFSSESGEYSSSGSAMLEEVSSAYPSENLSFASTLTFGDLYQDSPKDELIVFPWYDTAHGGKRFQGHEYKVMILPGSTWEQTRDFCESLGGHLVTITSQEENRFVKNLVYPEYMDWWWFGTGMYRESGAWHWVTGESVSDFQNWQVPFYLPGTPTDGETHMYVNLMQGISLPWIFLRGTWLRADPGTNDQTSWVPFVCEWESINRTFVNPSPIDTDVLPEIWGWDGTKYSASGSGFRLTLNDVDNQMLAFLAESTTFPSASIADINKDSLQDIIISNGRLAILWNIGNASHPKFKFDFNYFAGLNQRAPPNPILTPNIWDFDNDGDDDIAYSYGLDSSGETRYGMDFFENQGTYSKAFWVRNAYLMKNPDIEGSLRFNNYTAGVIDYSETNASLWVWNGIQNHLKQLISETRIQSSFILGTNPELLKLEINQRQSPPEAVNFGYSILKSWTNLEELDKWTLTLSTSLNLDNDLNGEIIVSDFDNNLYVFEHLSENTYKRAWKSQDLNHTEETDYSPYAFQDLDGVSGDFRTTIFDHGNLLASGFDYDKDGNKEFILTAALSVYIFEATGFNDEYELLFEKDYQEYINISQNLEFTALALTPDFGGRGPIIAIASESYLCVLRYDQDVGWVESLQSISGEGFSGIPGISGDYPYLNIRTLLFADFNHDGNTELWIGGQNSSETRQTGFLLALDSDFGYIEKIYEFPAISTVVNALEVIDADYDGFLELVIAHGHGLDIWESISHDPGVLQFRLLNYISSDPNYGQEQVLSPIFDQYQSSTGLAPRSNDILALQDGINYFSIYGVEENTHDSYLYQDIEALLQNESLGGGRLFYNVSEDPSNLGSMKNPNAQISESIRPILITEVYYPAASSNHWVELYNPNWWAISLDGWTLDFVNASGSISVPLSGTIDAHGFYVIANDNTTFTTQYPSAPIPDLENLSLDLGDEGNLSLTDDTLITSDAVEWGGGSYWNLIASGTSLVRNVTIGYLGSIVPLDSDDESDWGNIVPLGKPGQGNYTSSPLAYEVRPYITQNPDTDIVTITWIAAYLTPNNVNNKYNYPVNAFDLYGIGIYLRQFYPNGTPLTPSNSEIVSILARYKSPVIYTDLAIIDFDNSLILAYIEDDIQGISNTSGNLAVQKINTTDWTITDISSFVGIAENYTVSSVDLVEINNNLGVFFSGTPRNSYKNDGIYFTSLNSTYQNQGIGLVISGVGDFMYVSATTGFEHPNYVFLTCENIDKGKSSIIATFSTDGGTNWAQYSSLYQLDSNLEEIDELGSLKTTVTQVSVYNYQIINPQITIDNTGGIYYQFNTRFLIQEGSDPNYLNNLVEYYGYSYHLVTQQWIGQLENGTWFEYDNIFNVRDIAVGDSDNDLRMELFISHDIRVTLLEISSSDSIGVGTYVQKWQYTPPSFLSANPDQVNSSYVQYLASTIELERDTGSVEIADTNGNGWAELIFTVVGGDVFSFELKDLDQPINGEYLITEPQEEFSAEFPDATPHVQITEVMYDPENPEAKWIELHNPTNQELSLSFWSLSDNDGAFWLPIASSNISANGYLVVAMNGTLFAELYSLTEPLEWITSPSPQLTLNPLGDTLILRDGGGTEVDSVAWGTDAVSLGYDLAAFNSTIRRISLYDSDSGDDWEDSESFGSPETDPSYLLPQAIRSSYLVDCNNDENLDLLLGDGTYGRGILAWDLTGNFLIWHISIPGELKEIYVIDTGSDQLILGISTKGVMGLNLGGSKRYWIPTPSINAATNHVFIDVDQDSDQDLILASNTDVKALDIMTGNIIWDNPSVDLTASGYFDLSATNFHNSVYIAVSSSDFTSYRKINVLDTDGNLVNSFIHSPSVIFDSNSKSILDDFDSNGQLDLLLFIADNFNIQNPQSRIEVWNIETLDATINLTIPLLEGANMEMFDLSYYDVNNDSVEDMIFSIPEFNKSISSSFAPSTEYSSGVFALDISSGGSILWRRYFEEPLVKLDVQQIGTTNETMLLAYSKDSGVFGISYTGEDVVWNVGNNLTITTSISIVDGINFLTTDSNGTCRVSQVVGKLSSADNIITEIPYTLKPTTIVSYQAQAFAIPVEVSRDSTEQLLIAYTNGTLLLRSLTSLFWKIQIEPFSRITATGLDLDRLNRDYGLAIKTDTGNLIILDKTSISVVNYKNTNAENISAVNLGLNSDFLLMQSISGDSGKLSLYDHKSNSFIWNYTSSAYFKTWTVLSLDYLSPGQKTHIIALDKLGRVHSIELPTSTIPGGIFPSPSEGGKWTILKTLENTNKLGEVYLVSDSNQLVHYSWLTNGDILEKDFKHTISDSFEVVNLDILPQPFFPYLLFTTQNAGIKIYNEGISTLTLVKDDLNNYIGSSDHIFADLNNLGENEVLLISGGLLFVKQLVVDEINEIYSFGSFISTLDLWYADSSGKPLMLASLEDGTIAVADRLGRPILSGVATGAEIADLDFPPDPLTDEIEENFGNSSLVTLISISLVLIIFVGISFEIKRRKYPWKTLYRRLSS